MLEIIYENDEKYSNVFKKIRKRPNKLYVKGNIKLLNSKCIAVVGSRICSEYGRRVAERMSYQLAESGLTIVSGMALGIDTSAHKGALNYNGKTIAVLGSGFNNIYPEKNEYLFNQIIQSGGLIVSEYSPETEAVSKYFPVRNRIITGLSEGIVVVEAGYRSGASLTAHMAMKERKKVFCVPSNIENKYNNTNKLIQEGAILINNINDIFKGLAIEKNTDVQKYNCYDLQHSADKSCAYTQKNQEINFIPEGYRKVYNLLSKEPVNINYVCKSLNVEISKISSLLMIMELEGYIEQLPGKMFKTKENL